MLAGFRTAARRWAHTISSPSQVQIDLWKGWPSPELLPPSHLRKASGAALSDPEIWEPGLSYGADDGYFPLRQELAKWLTSFYEAPQAIETERICITGGASQNLACLLQTFTDAIYTRNIWMVAPTYYLACRIFDDAGFAGKIRGVPEDEHGVDVGYLSQQVEKSEAKAREEHNVEAVRSQRWKLDRKEVTELVAFIEIETASTMEEDIPTHNIRCGILCQSVQQNSQPRP